MYRRVYVFVLFCRSAKILVTNIDSLMEVANQRVSIFSFH